MPLLLRAWPSMCPYMLPPAPPACLPAQPSATRRRSPSSSSGRLNWIDGWEANSAIHGHVIVNGGATLCHYATSQQSRGASEVPEKEPMSEELQFITLPSYNPRNYTTFRWPS